MERAVCAIHPSRCVRLCSPRPAATPPAGTPGHRRGCRGHRTDARDRRLPIGAAWSGSPSTRASASSASGHGAPVFTGDLLAFQSLRCGLAALLRHVAGFPDLGLLRGLRPTPEAISRRRACPPPAWLAGGKGDPESGSHVHHAPVDGGGAQLFPCSLATGTPQAFPVASGPADASTGLGVARPAVGWACTAARPISTRLEPVASLEGVPPLVHSRYTFPSRLPGPGRLAVPTRPVVVRAAPTLPCASRVRLPPASPACCDRPEVGPFIPPGNMAPRGAPRRRCMPRPHRVHLLQHHADSQG